MRIVMKHTSRLTVLAAFAVSIGAGLSLKAGDLTDDFVVEARRAYARPEYQGYTNSLTGKGRFALKPDQPRADLGGRLVRWVDVEGTCNFRDIGGWNGLRTGLVYRGAEPNCHTNADYLARHRQKCHNLMATDRGLRVLSEDLGIRTDLDLRSERQSPTPKETPIPGARLLRIPCGNYTNFLLNTEIAARLLRVFADRANYPVYIHCYGGADRTGSLAFLLEGLCGVPEIDLSIDYELTSFSRMGRRARFDRPYYYASMLAAIRRRPGATLRDKFEHYAVDECGLTRQEVSAIRQILVGRSPSSRPPVRTDPDRNATTINPGLVRIGTLRTRDAKDVGPANWTIDAGPVDRDFVDFDKYRDYLPALGVAKIRIMTGWAKSERTKGTIDVAWLDHIVDWCKAHGIEPVLELSYGNPIYEGAGGAGLRDGIPNTPAGLDAWDRWVDFLGNHFKGRVREWAMWNEPDINPEANPPEAVAAFNVRSAKMLKRHMPDCRLHGLSLAHNDAKWLADCIRPMGEDARLFDTFVYHGYVRNPDVSYAMVERQKAVLAELAPHAKLRQGENGCASEWLDRFSLRYAPWSELSQAKWNLRRMLGDLGHDVESGLFCFTDINYQPPTFPTFYCNRKGYLRLDASNEVIRVKRTYYAVQNAVSVFDATVTRVKASPRASCADRTVSLYEYETKDGAPLIVFWQHGPVTVRDQVRATFLGTGDLDVKMDENAAPGESLETRGIVIGWKGRPLADPVWVDLMTGWVYELPESQQLVHSNGIDFVEVPCYDSPCIVAERASLDLL